MTVDVLFLCPHHAAKSVLAAAYFNHFAEQRGLPLRANSAGTKPSEVVMPVVITMLAEDGMDVSRHQPRRVMMDELTSAKRVISMGCTPEELRINGNRIEHWNDVPAVSLEPDRARQAIQAHVEQLIDEMKARQ